MDSRPLSEQLANLPSLDDILRFLGRATTFDFSDDALRGQAGIKLVKLDTDEICRLGREMTSMFSLSFERCHVAVLLVLAYNLKSPSNYHVDVFQNLAGLDCSSDLSPIDLYNNTLSSHGNYDLSPRVSNNRNVEAAFYCYIAAASLRLFSKPAENFLKAWQHILRGFRRFYNEYIDLRLAVPHLDAVKRLAHWMNTYPLAKQTLYRILYISNSDDGHRELKEFLYDTYLSHTGMHMIKMFTTLATRMNCSPALILTLINEPEYGRQIRCLVRIVELMMNTDGLHTRKMWQYGRIFDEHFMADVTIKACPKLVCVFAEALIAVDKNMYAGFYQITERADVRNDTRMWCFAVAVQLLRSIRNYKTSGSSSQNTRRNVELRRTVNL